MAHEAEMLDEIFDEALTEEAEPPIPAALPKCEQPRRIENKRPRAGQLAGPNRRVLKAFYTQYVGVLLIILTFTVGAFQRTLNVPSMTIAPSIVIQEPALIGAITISHLFDPSGSLSSEAEQLRAMAELLTKHDVDLEVTVAVPRLSLESGITPFERGLQRLEQIERYFTERGVPAYAVRLNLITGTEESPASFRFRPSAGRPS